MSSGHEAPRWRRYLRFIRPDPASDVDDELEFHLAMRMERNLALGMPADEARRDALRRFGEVARWRDALVHHDRRRHATKERQQVMSDFLQDVRYAMRSLKRAPGMTLAIVLTLALGLGVNMAMFSFLDVVFLRPPAGVRAPEDIRRVWTLAQFMSGPQFWSGYDYEEYDAVRRAVAEQAATTVYRAPQNKWLRHGTRETQAAVSLAEASFFPLLGVRPSVGRFFTADEDRLGAGARVAVLSHGFWQQDFGADSAIIGDEVRIGGQPYTIIGVGAERFSGVELDRTDVWVPLATQTNFRGQPWWLTRNVNGFQLLLRPRTALSDDALAERVALGLRTLAARRSPGDTTATIAFGSIIRERGPGKRNQEVRIATRLAGVTVIVLLIACANVINLLLARALRRRREIAVRIAMGISRLRLARLLLTESVLLAIVAAGAAVFAAILGGELLRALLMPDVDFADSASPMHWRVITGALALGVGAGVLAGLLPVAQSMKTAVTGALKAGSGTSDRGQRSRLRDVLVVAQAALCVVLLVGAGLFVSSLRNVRGLRTGYDTPRLMYASVQFDTPDSARDAVVPERFRGVAERVRGMPGVDHVALTRMTPTQGFSVAAFHPDVDTLRYRKPFATLSIVSPEFFEATGMRLLRGEGFPRAVGRAMPAVVVVNDAFAKAQWPGMDAVGRCLRFPPETECYRVTGVVETAMFDKLIEDPQPQYYLPLDNPPRQVGSWFSTMVIKTQVGQREATGAALQRALRDAFPAGRPSITTMEQVMEPEYRPWRLGATLFTLFSVLALVVASLGIYSTIAYSVAQRTHEFGVRTALGARTGDILRQVLGSSARVVSVGIVLGVALALAAGRFVAALLYGVEPGDPRVMIGVAIVLFVVAILAAIGPAWRAARVNPVLALRSD